MARSTDSADSISATRLLDARQAHKTEWRSIDTMADQPMKSWTSKDGKTIFVDKGDGERIIVRDTDGDGFADGVYETGASKEAEDE